MLRLNFKTLQLLLFVTLVSLRDRNLLSLHLQLNFSLLIQICQLLRLTLHLLGLFNYLFLQLRLLRSGRGWNGSGSGAALDWSSLLWGRAAVLRLWLWGDGGYALLQHLRLPLLLNEALHRLFHHSWWLLLLHRSSRSRSHADHRWLLHCLRLHGGGWQSHGQLLLRSRWRGSDLRQLLRDGGHCTGRRDIKCRLNSSLWDRLLRDDDGLLDCLRDYLWLSELLHLRCLLIGVLRNRLHDLLFRRDCALCLELL